MPDTDRDPIPSPDRVPEGAGGLTDQAGDPGRAPNGADAPSSVEDLPAPRSTAGGDTTPATTARQDAAGGHGSASGTSPAGGYGSVSDTSPAGGSASAATIDPDPAPSQGSVGATDADPTIDRGLATPVTPEPNPTAPEALEPGVMPRDDVPPVGSSPASATGAILSQEDTANPTDPDGPADAIPGGTQPDDTPGDPGLAESPGPGNAPPLG